MTLQELVAKAQGGNDTAMTEVCCRFTGLIRKYAYQQHLRGISQEAEAEGWLAMVQAVRSYDGALGVPFAGYAEAKIKYAVWNLFKRERRRWDREAALEAQNEEQGMHTLERLPAAIDVAGEVETRLMAEHILALVRLLPARQRQALLGTLLDGRRLIEVARELGVSPQAVSNLRLRALRRLKNTFCGDPE